jgi:hypothetical protein
MADRRCVFYARFGHNKVVTELLGALCAVSDGGLCAAILKTWVFAFAW